MNDSFIQTALQDWETDGGASAPVHSLPGFRAQQPNPAREPYGMRLVQSGGFDGEVDTVWRGEVIAVRSLVSDRAWRSFRIMREPRRQA